MVGLIILKTKVMHILGQLNMGGAETLVTKYALYINKKEFDVVLVIIGDRNNSIIEKQLDEAGVRVIYIGNMVAFPKSTQIFKKVINMIHRYIIIARILNQEKPKVIHTHLTSHRYILPFNTKRRNIKFFYTIHSEIRVRFKKLSEKMITKYCIKKRGMIPIALHKEMQIDAKDFFNIDNCLVIPNAIEIKRFRDVSVDRQKLMEKLKIKEGAFIIGHVGRFATVKNHDFLIDVFSKIINKLPEAHLLLIGTGETQGHIKAKVKELGLEECISFLGNRDDIPELMSLMDVFVFPSLHEGFGNVLIEAQAAKVSCVVSDSVPSSTFITNLVTPLSLEKPIDLWVKTIINTRKPKNVIGNLERHDINSVMRDIEKIYLT